MAHVPHLYLPPPWDSAALAPPPETLRHLRRVLRIRDGEPVTYTDGAGTVGEGTFEADRVIRGDERTVPRPRPEVTLAIAAPENRDRARFCVEKLAELGVDRLIWVRTRHGGHRPPPREKAQAWAIGALEQSRGAWLLDIAGPRSLEELPRPAWCAHPGAPPLTLGLEATADGAVPVLVVGPEGGLADDEVAMLDDRFGLGPRILRVETAAIVGAALALAVSGRLSAPPFR